MKRIEKNIKNISKTKKGPAIGKEGSTKEDEMHENNSKSN